VAQGCSAPDGGDTSGSGLVAPCSSGCRLPPYGGYFDEWPTTWSTPSRGAARHTAGIERVVIDRGEMTLSSPAASAWPWLAPCVTPPRCASRCGNGVSGVHYPHESGRELHAVYHLLSITNGGRRIVSR
jgi:NADH-quinone oxidoreductase subunit C